MAEYDEIERAIVRGLNSILKTRVASSGRDRDWTIKVKRTLGKLGQELGYQVCASDPKGRFEAEWLFDLIWYDYDHEEHLEKVPLILEMEWAMSYKEIKWDFEKLVVGRADHRVMIFQAPNARTIDDHCRRLIRNITTFELSTSGDRYLFAAYDQKSDCFVCRQFQY